MRQEEYSVRGAFPTKDELLQAITDNSGETFRALTEELHPAELGNAISALPADHQTTASLMVEEPQRFADLLSHANELLLTNLLEATTDSKLVSLIRLMEPDDAANLLRQISRRRQVAILKKFGPARTKQLKTLLSYEEDTAGSIMTPNFLSASQESPVGEVLKDLRSQLAEETTSEANVGSIFILDKSESLVGKCRLRTLLASDNAKSISEISDLDPISVPPETDQEVVAKLMADYDLNSLPIVSEDSKKLLGLVTIDDIVDVIEEETTEDILKLAGTVDEDTVGASISTALKSRMPWLFASWVGGVLAAMIMGNFTETLEKVVALAFFMPVVFGMGGNIGSQSTTITVRGLATGDIKSLNIKDRLKKEFQVGLILGLCFAVLLSPVSYLLFSDAKLSIVVGVAIFITMTIAATLGSMLPLLFERLGVDPAIASGPLVTTSTDILSVIVYFLIASLSL